MSKLNQMQKTLDDGSGKYLLAYRTKDNEKIYKGLPVYKNKRTAENAAKRISEQIDVIIECWVEDA